MKIYLFSNVNPSRKLIKQLVHFETEMSKTLKGGGIFTKDILGFISSNYYNWSYLPT